MLPRQAAMSRRVRGLSDGPVGFDVTTPSTSIRRSRQGAGTKPCGKRKNNYFRRGGRAGKRARPIHALASGKTARTVSRVGSREKRKKGETRDPRVFFFSTYFLPPDDATVADYFVYAAVCGYSDVDALAFLHARRKREKKTKMKHSSRLTRVLQRNYCNRKITVSRKSEREKKNVSKRESRLRIRFAQLEKRPRFLPAPSASRNACLFPPPLPLRSRRSSAPTMAK